MINTKKDRPDFGLKSVTSSLRKKLFNLHICQWEEAKGLYIDKLTLLVFVQVNRTIHKKRQTALY